MSRARARRVGIVAVAGLLSLLVMACNPFGRTYTYRYRITVEVDTPQGLRTGSGVWESTIEDGSGLGDNSIGLRARGEAVPIDLPGGTLFALLRGHDMELTYPTDALDTQYTRVHQLQPQPFGGWKDVRKLVTKNHQPLTLDSDNYPLLVRFRDLNNPASVEKVDPNDLAASFGPGVRLRRIVVQVTDEPVTEGIEKRLPWLPAQRGMLVKVPSDTPMNAGPFPSLLTEGYFKRSR